MARKPARKAKTQKKRAVKRAAPRRTKKPAARSKRASAPKRRATASRKKRLGGTGRESTLAQTPATGRTVTGRTNPMPTKRSTGTAAGAGDPRRIPGLQRDRKQLREVEESPHPPPSRPQLDRHDSAARSGRDALRH